MRTSGRIYEECAVKTSQVPRGDSITPIIAGPAQVYITGPFACLEDLRIRLMYRPFQGLERNRCNRRREMAG
jgi:hypothetical protein